MQQLADTARRFAALAPAANDWSIRLVAEESEHLEVRQGVADLSALSLGRGAMVTLVRCGGVGYAATSDVSDAGLAAAARRAGDWAEAHARLGLFDARLRKPGSENRGQTTKSRKPGPDHEIASVVSVSTACSCVMTGSHR